MEATLAQGGERNPRSEIKRTIDQAVVFDRAGGVNDFFRPFFMRHLVRLAEHRLTLADLGRKVRVKLDAAMATVVEYGTDDYRSKWAMQSYGRAFAYYEQHRLHKYDMERQIKEERKRIKRLP